MEVKEQLQIMSNKVSMVTLCVLAFLLFSFSEATVEDAIYDKTYKMHFAHTILVDENEITNNATFREIDMVNEQEPVQSIPVQTNETAKGKNLDRINEEELESFPFQRNETAKSSEFSMKTIQAEKKSKRFLQPSAIKKFAKWVGADNFSVEVTNIMGEEATHDRGCPFFFVHFRDKCYVPFDVLVTWQEAVNYCKLFAAKLAVPTNEKTDQAIAIIGRNSLKTMRLEESIPFWLGVRFYPDLGWKDYENMKPAWKRIQFKPRTPDDKCVYTSTPSRPDQPPEWGARNCELLGYFICEREEYLTYD